MLKLFKAKERQRQEKLLRKFVEDHRDPPQTNIFPKPCEAQEALNFLEDLILGPDWYVVDPLPTVQVNTVAVLEIAKKYMKTF